MGLRSDHCVGPRYGTVSSIRGAVPGAVTGKVKREQLRVPDVDTGESQEVARVGWWAGRDFFGGAGRNRTDAIKVLQIQK